MLFAASLHYSNIVFASPPGDNKLNVCLEATNFTAWTVRLLCSFAREGQTTVSLDQLGLCFPRSLDTLQLCWLYKSGPEE